MLSNLASSLILHKRVSTTVAKAKALRKYVEPLLTKSKNDTTHSRRTVFAYLQNKESVKELFDEVSVKIANRPGGYTRILKTGYRLGDNAEMCVIELVDYNEDMLTTTGTAAAGAKKTRRRGGKKKAEGTAAEAAPAAEAPETPAAESNDATEDTKDAK
ncbi:LSU ribosomal protein L17P [Pontibacter chinhatensis]|uniref:50S ribosomal protein L17 n=2 Tax=Pontibacter chinhatensis TaxID=1436961 RepID=A0A1I2VP87_9BACT|nr:LSU ribosomal protein L17P [Pontibacter chinhatensis]